MTEYDDTPSVLVERIRKEGLLAVVLSFDGDTIEKLEARIVSALVGVQRPEDVARAIWIAGSSGRGNDDWELERAASFGALEIQTAFRQAHAVLALPHTGQPQEGWFLPGSALNELQIATLEHFLSHAKRANEIDCKVRKDGKETLYELDSLKHLSAAPASLRAEGWQPINTAPDDRERRMFWLDWADDCRPLNPAFLDDDAKRLFIGSRKSWGSIYKATHWRPLPAPPAIVAEKQTP